jgi:MFS family permease
MALAGAAFCIPAGLLIKTVGRRLALMLFVIPLTIGWIFTLWARNAAMIYFARTFIGCAAGGYCIGVPVYVGEIAQSNVRGKLLSYFQLTLTLGILFVYTIGYLASLFWATVICAILPLILTTGLYFMPESPTYLVRFCF